MAEWVLLPSCYESRVDIATADKSRYVAYQVLREDAEAIVRAQEVIERLRGALLPIITRLDFASNSIIMPRERDVALRDVRSALVALAAAQPAATAGAEG